MATHESHPHAKDWTQLSQQNHMKRLTNTVKTTKVKLCFQSIQTVSQGRYMGQAS